jgi:hypothetical protein
MPLIALTFCQNYVNDFFFFFFTFFLLVACGWEGDDSIEQYDDRLRSVAVCYVGMVMMGDD